MHIGLSRKTMRKIDWGIEELILFAIILLNLLDGFEILSPDWDYVKKIISWTALGILFYRSKISRIISGSDIKRVDILLIIGYFSMIIKNLVSYVFSVNKDATSFLQPFYSFLITNYALIETVGIYFGIICLLYASLYFALKFDIKKPSLISFFYNHHGKSRHLKESLNRTLIFFTLSLLFFVGVFNLVMEWLAIAIDAPLLITGLAIYFLFILKHREKFHPDSFLGKFGDFGSRIYQSIIEHLRYKKTVFLVVGVVLVLHMVTDIFNFMWPYILGISDPLYFALLGPNHTSLLQLFSQNATNMTFGGRLFLGLIYLFNTWGILFLLGFSAFLWYLMYKKKQLKLNPWLSNSFFISLIIFLTIPIFKIQKLASNGLHGIDIQTHLATVPSFNSLLTLFFITSFVLILLNFFRRKLIDQILIVCSQLFFIFYVFSYFQAITEFYIITIFNQFTSGAYGLGLIFVLLFVCTNIFYILGIFGFEYNVYKFLKREHEF